MAPKMIIKKLNTMFHKHSRWLFGGFTIVIIISFMGFLTPGQFGCDGFGSGSGMTVGTAFGEKVTLGDLEQIRRENDVLARAGMSMGRDMDYSEAFQRYCLEVAARRQGLAVGDAEVIDFVKKFPVFQENGQYSPARYKEFKENLVRAGGSDELFVEALRGVLLSAKLQNQLGYNRVVTDGELEAFYRRDNVKYDVKTAIFSTDAYLKDVKNDPAAMKAYFDEHAGNYRISGKVAAFLVEFPNARYLKEAEAKATDAEVKKFFDTRPQLFVKLAKDGKMPEFEACKRRRKPSSSRPPAAILRCGMRMSLQRPRTMRSAKPATAGPRCSGSSPRRRKPRWSIPVSSTSMRRQSARSAPPSCCRI